MLYRFLYPFYRAVSRPGVRQYPQWRQNVAEVTQSIRCQLMEGVTRCLMLNLKRFLHVQR